MKLKLIQKNNGNILPICFYGQNRNNGVLQYHQKVMQFLGIPMNYLEIPFDRTGHGDAIQWLINATIDDPNIHYWWFCDMDCIPLRKDFVDILYSKIKDGQSIFGPALATNHRQFKDHIYAAAFCLSFSKKVYIDLSRPDMRDLVERSDNSQELTWRAQEQGKIVSFMYPTSYQLLTDEEMKETGNPRYFELGKFYKYGMSTQYGDLIFHGFMQNIPRSNYNFINKCKEILGENNRERKNEAVIVCVGFADFLEITIPLNKDKFDNILVVTTHEDIKTQNYCISNNINFCLTDKFYQDNALFNKGLAISEALSELKYKDIITILDSDIILPDNFKEKLDIQNFNNNKFYGAGRHFIYTYEDLLDYSSRKKNINDFQFIKGAGNGYLQIFSYEELVTRTPHGQSLYSSNKENIQIDIDVLKRFCPLIEHDPNLVDLNMDIIHLGLHSVWKNGRDKARFDYFNNKKFKEIKRDEVSEYIKEINK
jgi:hypothetical protein